MKLSEWIRPLIEVGEQTKANQTIPEKWKRKLLAVNRGFIREAKKYHEALEILEGSKELLEKANKGKITMEQYSTKIRRAKEQKEEVEIFFRELSEIIKQKKGKKDLSQILLNNERMLKSAFL